MSYLAVWRLALAADLLVSSDAGDGCCAPRLTALAALDLVVLGAGR